MNAIISMKNSTSKTHQPNRKSKNRAKLQNILDNAESYSEWKAAAKAYDDDAGGTQWRNIEESTLYDFTEIRQRLDQLRLHRKEGDDLALLFALNEGIHGNMGGMGKSILYHRSKLGTKYLIEQYVDEIVESLQHIAQLNKKIISPEEKRDFFHRANLCCGRSALMLSGGGSLGHFHLGVLKALMEENLVPSVLSGASAGAFVSAIFGTRNKKDMLTYLNSEELYAASEAEASWINRLFREGKSDRYGIEQVEHSINELIPNLTFQEAYALSGYRINISVAPAEEHQTSRLLNAITSPNVYVRDAVKASCAIPGVYPAVTLNAKNVKGESQPYLPSRKWVDGSISDDLPAKRLSRLYGVNHYIGSLINPIVMYANDDSIDRGIAGKIARKVSHKSVSGWARNMQSLTQKYGKNWPRLKMFSSMANSIFSQHYEADIAVFPDFKNFNLSKITSPLTASELMDLVQQGERATWANMDMIRTSSKISRAIEDILIEL